MLRWLSVKNAWRGATGPTSAKTAGNTCTGERENSLTGVLELIYVKRWANRAVQLKIVRTCVQYCFKLTYSYIRFIILKTNWTISGPKTRFISEQTDIYSSNAVVQTILKLLKWGFWCLAGILVRRHWRESWRRAILQMRGWPSEAARRRSTATRTRRGRAKMLIYVATPVLYHTYITTYMYHLSIYCTRTCDSHRFRRNGIFLHLKGHNEAFELMLYRLNTNRTFLLYIVSQEQLIHS